MAVAPAGHINAGRLIDHDTLLQSLPTGRCTKGWKDLFFLRWRLRCLSVRNSFQGQIGRFRGWTCMRWSSRQPSFDTVAIHSCGCAGESAGKRWWDWPLLLLCRQPAPCSIGGGGVCGGDGRLKFDLMQKEACGRSHGAPGQGPATKVHPLSWSRSASTSEKSLATCEALPSILVFVSSSGQLLHTRGILA